MLGNDCAVDGGPGHHIQRSQQYRQDIHLSYHTRSEHKATKMALVEPKALTQGCGAAFDRALCVCLLGISALASYVFNHFRLSYLGIFSWILTGFSFLYRDDVGYTRRNTKERTQVAVTKAGYNYLLVDYFSHNVITVNNTNTHEKYTFLWVRHVRLMANAQ